MNSAKQIYVVEDEPIVSLHITQTLEDFGYKVAGSASTGEDAVAAISKHSPDLVLMDIRLRGKIDGIETATQIQSHSQVPIVFLTAFNDEHTLQRAKLTRPYGYLIKPFDPNELRSTIEVALSRSELEAPAEQSVLSIDEEDLEIGSPDVEGRLDFLSKVPGLSKCGKEILSELAKNSEIRTFEGGEFLSFEGEKANGGFVVVSGRVSLVKANASGKELTLTLLSPGDPFGLCLLLPHLNSVASARFQINSKILWISRSAFQGVMNDEPPLMNFLIEELSRRLVDSYELAMSLAHTRVEYRIIQTLMALLPKLGKGLQDGKSNGGRIFMTRKELADLTGTTPETAIRVTKSLERDGLLDLTRAGIIKILDIEKLKRLAGQGAPEGQEH